MKSFGQVRNRKCSQIQINVDSNKRRFYVFVCCSLLPNVESSGILYSEIQSSKQIQMISFSLVSFLLFERVSIIDSSCCVNGLMTDTDDGVSMTTLQSRMTLCMT